MTIMIAANTLFVLLLKVYHDNLISAYIKEINMHFILPYFIIILVVIQLLLKKSDNSQQNKIKQFWEREQKANATRKQDISNLNYVKWDDSLPLKEEPNSF